MNDDIRNIINRCPVCLRNNRGKVWNHSAIVLDIDGIHDWVHIDLKFELNETNEGFVGVLVMIESLSDYTWCKPIKTSSKIAGNLMEYISLFGQPKEILSDLGRKTFE